MTEPTNHVVPILLFVTVACLTGADLVADFASGTPLAHVGTEGVGAALALVGAALLFRRTLAERAETARWRAQAEELLAGVGSSVEDQFTAWALSPAEREVALLLLKGLSFKEIAAVRGTAERTSREQARAVYRKAGVNGRPELSAWFIEDLLPPMSP